jgi:hypothetical protein
MPPPPSTPYTTSSTTFFFGKFIRKDLPQVVKVGANTGPPFPSAALPCKVCNCYDQIHD